MDTFCLWINGKKVNDVEGIKENFNISDVRGYYLGGMLVQWLKDRKAEKEADAVSAIPKNENPDEYLFSIFQNRYTAPVYHTCPDKGTRKDLKIGGPFSSNGSYSPLSSYSYTGGSFNASSYISSGLFSHSFLFGSFNKSSFNLNIGSFRFGSFSVGSSRMGSFAPLVNGSFGGCLSDTENSDIFNASVVNTSVIDNSDKRFFQFGSYNHFAELYASYIEEPLNCYGYGINNI